MTKEPSDFDPYLSDQEEGEVLSPLWGLRIFVYLDREGVKRLNHTWVGDITEFEAIGALECVKRQTQQDFEEIGE